MPDSIQRPEFFEGQVLGAGDLEAGVDYDRARAARHDRNLHSWGIAEGLALDTQKATTATGEPYVSVTVVAGVAIDGSGREIVLPEDTLLNEGDFSSLNIVAQSDSKDTWYPVFLVGRDLEVTGRQSLTDACSNGQATRIIEDAAITFGRPGETDGLDDQEDLSDVTAGPDGGIGDTQPWKVLVGFVRWNNDQKVQRFTAVASSNVGGPAVSAPVSRRYAGVRADDVSARGGSVTLRTRPRGFVPDPNAMPPTKPMILVVDEAAQGKELSFGFPDTDPVFTVSGKGDVAFTGSLKPGLAAGLQAESGVATDGMILPLPGNVTQAQVDAGQIVVHVHVSPALPFSAPPKNTGEWVPIAIECSADGQRQVRCRATWIDIGTMPPTSVHQTFGACNYTVLAAAPVE